VIQTGNKYKNYLKTSAAEAFSTVFGYIAATFSGGGNGCDASSGTGFVCGTGTDSDPRLYVHELGHVFAGRDPTDANPNSTLGNSVIVDALGRTVWRGYRAEDGYIRTMLGYVSNGAPNVYHGELEWTDWNSSDNYIARNEDFADMYMNWMYNSFSDDSAGNSRYAWISSNMNRWINQITR
jgi:hypothetical protein